MSINGREVWKSLPQWPYPGNWGLQIIRTPLKVWFTYSLSIYHCKGPYIQEKFQYRLDIQTKVIRENEQNGDTWRVYLSLSGLIVHIGKYLHWLESVNCCINSDKNKLDILLIVFPDWKSYRQYSWSLHTIWNSTERPAQHTLRKKRGCGVVSVELESTSHLQVRCV